MKNNKHQKLIILCYLIFATFNFYAQTVINGVATYTQNTNIGRKFPVPDSWNKILIKENVTITGSFYMGNRSKPIEIAGENRKTSVIQGDGSRPTDDGIKGRSYSAIRCDASPDVYVHDLKITRPMKFHIHGGFGNVTVERCDIIAGTETFTTDGIHGGKGKTIVRDCYIDCYDDALYTIECKLIENTTIVHNKNGAPFMTSWGADVPNNHTSVIRNCTVIDNYNGTDYNHGVFAWAQKNDAGNQTINLKFEGTFTYKVNPGKKSSTMYTIGRPGTTGISDAYMLIDGQCPRKESIEIRGNTNSKVSFTNCPEGNCKISNINISTIDAICGNPNGEINFSFSDNPNKNSIQISIDGGVNFSAPLNNDSGNFSIKNLNQGEYNCFAKYGDQTCLTDLGKIIINCKGNVSIAEGTFYIEARHSNKFLEVENSSLLDGGNIQQWENKFGSNKQWKIKNYTNEWFTIVNINSNKAMEVANFSQENRGNIQQSILTYADNQLWKFVNPDDEWHQIVSKSSSKVIDVTGVSILNGANIHQWDLQENRNNQQFSFREVESLNTIDINKSNFNVEIFPNPATNFINIKTENFQGKANLLIYSITGLLISKNSINQPLQHISITGLKAGVYLLKLIFESKKATQLLIVK
jgi:hypothetical protein